MKKINMFTDSKKKRDTIVNNRAKSSMGDILDQITGIH